MEKRKDLPREKNLATIKWIKCGRVDILREDKGIKDEYRMIKGMLKYEDNDRNTNGESNIQENTKILLNHEGIGSKKD